MSIKYFSGQVAGVQYIHKIYEQISENCKNMQFRVIDSFIIPKELELEKIDVVNESNEDTNFQIGTITKYEYWFMVEVFDQPLEPIMPTEPTD